MVAMVLSESGADDSDDGRGCGYGDNADSDNEVMNVEIALVVEVVMASAAVVWGVLTR